MKMNKYCTANPTWGDIFECCFKAQSSKLERLFPLKRDKRDLRALSFELSKMSPQVGLAVLLVLFNRSQSVFVKNILLHIHGFNKSAISPFLPSWAVSILMLLTPLAEVTS